MNTKLEIRESGPDDIAGIESLYCAAFPDEDLVPLVRDLLSGAAIVLSLVASNDSRIVGHVIFTTCSLTGCEATAALLAPLAVRPERQKQGLGGLLVEAGMARLRAAGVARVFVLGDPAYYKRFGFLPDSQVPPPYTLPADQLPEEWRGAWQSKRLDPGETPLSGELVLPQPWLQPSLWLP